jgi:aryl-alcohol dehydrogenase-like predicted oxidoreductase
MTDVDLDPETRPLAIGCMRLSTERDGGAAQPDGHDAGAIAVLHAALDAGVTLLDTADAYCLNEHDVGHNERLIARALGTWGGDRSTIVVATKGGLRRPGGQWVPDGRARHLRAACEASLVALGVERLDLYQLHAPDPRVPLSTSVRALAALKAERLVARVGLCNVNVGQIAEARRITEIASVQVELSVWHDEALLNGVVEYCVAHRILCIAARPLGGRQRLSRLQRDPVLRAVAERHAATPAEIALAWLADRSPSIVPIPGPTRVDTVRSIVRAHQIRLADEDRAELGARSSPLDHSGRVVSPTAPAAAPIRDGEVVLIMGLPGAGKSTAARAFADEGYARLNRDEAGGSLRGLLPGLERLVTAGHSRVVLDNTYMSRASRARVILAARALGLPVRCVWLATSVEDAQVNAVTRIIASYGRLLQPDEMREAVQRDVSAFAPTVQFRHQRELEPPDPAEGFSRIDVVPFERRVDPWFTNRALIVWCDNRLGERGAALRRYRDDGWLLLGLAWCPQVADGTMTTDEVEGRFAHMQAQLGVAIDVHYCPHPAGPPRCWCRKPLPGLGVVMIQRHRLDPSRCLYVGPGPQDAAFARRLGFEYRQANEFFTADPP